MKNKKNIRILLPVVIIIWGLLIYKVVDAFSPDEIAGAQVMESNFVAPEIQKKERFELLPIASDPFLGTVYYKPKKISGKSTSKSKTEIVWPAIDYFGIVSGENSKSSVFILQVNGQQHLLNKGEAIEGVLLLKGSEESVLLRYKGQTKEFPIM